MELEPTRATFAQISATKDGRLIEIEDDVQNVVNDLHEIDPHLRVRFSEAGGYFVVYWKPDGEELGSGDLVTTAQELDQRLVNLVRRLHHQAQDPGYSFADELEAVEKKKKADEDHARMEQNGEMYERLAHAMRKETGRDQSRVLLVEKASKPA